MKNLYLKVKSEIISWYYRIIFRIMQTLKFLVYNWEYKTFAEKTFWAERIGRKNRYAIFWPVEIVQRTWEKTKIEFARKKNICYYLLCTGGFIMKRNKIIVGLSALLVVSLITTGCGKKIEVKNGSKVAISVKGDKFTATNTEILSSFIFS